MNVATGYILHGTILTLCGINKANAFARPVEDLGSIYHMGFINTVLLTFNYGVYNLHHDDFAVFSYSGNLSFYLMKPDIPFPLHVLLLLLGGFIPGSSGLGLIKVNKKMSRNVRRVHVLSAVTGTVCTAVLTVTEANSIHEIHSLSCSGGYHAGSCWCGVFITSLSPSVCDMKPVRITYLSLLCINLVCDIISLCLSTKMGKDVSVRNSNITVVKPMS